MMQRPHRSHHGGPASERGLQTAAFQHGCRRDWHREGFNAKKGYRFIARDDGAEDVSSTSPLLNDRGSLARGYLYGRR
jgi:hypothetical protein